MDLTFEMHIMRGETVIVKVLSHWPFAYHWHLSLAFRWDGITCSCTFRILMSCLQILVGLLDTGFCPSWGLDLLWMVQTQKKNVCVGLLLLFANGIAMSSRQKEPSNSWWRSISRLRSTAEDRNNICLRSYGCCFEKIFWIWFPWNLELPLHPYASK